MRSSTPCATRRAERSTSSRALPGVDVIKPFLKNDPASWNLIIHVNYLGPVRMIHRLLPSMIEAGGGGKIVTVASDAGRVGSSGETFYAGSKGAVIAFTKSLARETARYRINCNCVAPGPTETPLFLDATEQKLQDALSTPFRSSDWRARARSPTPSCTSRRRRRTTSPDRCSASAAA